MRPVITKTIFLFTLVQIASLLAGLKFQQKSISVVENSASPENSIYLFASILVLAAVLLLILKYYKGKLLFLLLELAMEFTAFQILASLFVSSTAATAVALAAVGIRLAKQETKQIILLVTVAIVGGLLGTSLDILPAALLAALLAGYDVIAVFYTKHMVTLAKQLTQRQAAFTLKVTHEKDKLELGTGDVVIPATIIVSANKIGSAAFTVGTSSFSFPALFAFIGAIIGLAALLFYLEKKKGYWPALPPLAVASLIGVALGTLL